VRDASIDVITNIFAPCAEAEFCRALKDGGHLLLVGAGERHLMGLKEQIYADAYANAGRADLPERMELVKRRRVHERITVEGREMIEALFSMTPYYWRTSKADHAKLATLDSLTTEVDFDLFLYRKTEE
jgi:23S rRNA (guanine745-N1)-methyltransferase